MLKILHGADFHLDSPFSGLSPQQAARRRGEQRQLLSRLGELAREEGCDLVLLAGDLFDSERVYPETVRALTAALADIPCPVFIAPGNHDFYTPRSPYAAAQWPGNVHIFKTPAVQAVELPELGCVVHGAAFTAPHQAQSPLAHFQAERDGRRHIMVLHGDTAGGDYGPISQEDIARSGLDYLALGHVHQYSGMQRAGDTLWLYPGCAQGRGFDELGEKGAALCCLSGEESSARLLPLGGRQYRMQDIDVTDQKDLAQAVRAALPEGSGSHIWRLRLTGERGTEGLDLEGLRAQLAPEFYGLTLRDATRLRREVWEHREEDSLRGLFLQQLWEQRTQENEALVELAARFGLSALENGEEAVL